MIQINQKQKIKFLIHVALLKKTGCNAKITEIESKIPSISGLATNAALTTILKIKYLILVVQFKKTDYNTKNSELKKKLTDHNHDKYITTQEFNTLAADVFHARLAQANLITKTDFEAKLPSLNRKITANKTQDLLVGNEFKRLKTFDLSYFRGKSHFEEDGTKNYLVFQPIYRDFKVLANTKYILSWKFKGLSDETIKPPAISDNSLSPLIDYLDNKKD